MNIANSPDNPFLFVHVPKTAGSSFRVALENYFGSDAVYYDYGQDSAVTHPKIVEYTYQKHDRYLIKKDLFNTIKLLSGHFPYHKYGPLFRPRDIITFIRKPDQQIKSHFEHYVRHHNYKKDFISFIKEKRFINLQSRNLRGIPLEAYGFIGITEFYNDSVDLFNQYYNLNIENLSLNRNEDRTSLFYDIKENELELIHKLNEDDFRLYERALKQFNQHKDCIKNEKSFLRFGLSKLPPRQAKLRISGWLTCYESDQAQKITISVNGKKQKSVNCSTYISLGQERNLNRNGFIGFTFEYPKNIADDDIVEIFSESNNDLLYSNAVSDVYKDFQN